MEVLSTVRLCSKTNSTPSDTSGDLFRHLCFLIILEPYYDLRNPNICTEEARFFHRFSSLSSTSSCPSMIMPASVPNSFYPVAPSNEGSDTEISHRTQGTQSRQGSRGTGKLYVCQLHPRSPAKTILELALVFIVNP